MTLYRTRSGREVDSTLTRGEATDLLARSTSTFGRSLRDQRQAFQGGRYYHGYLAREWTDEQTAWAMILAEEVRARASAPDGAAGAGGVAPAVDDLTGLDFTALLAHLNHSPCGPRARLPRLKFRVAGQPVAVSMAGGRSRHPGTLTVTDGRQYPTSTYFGRILTDGSFRPTARPEVRGAYRDVWQLLRDLAADPVATVHRHGIQTGACCFCGRPLTVSTVGYGPDCAARYNLPYDSLTNQARAGARRARERLENRLRGGEPTRAGTDGPCLAETDARWTLATPGARRDAAAGWESLATPAAPAPAPAATHTGRPATVAEFLARNPHGPRTRAAHDVLSAMETDLTPEALAALARTLGVID